MVARIWSPSSKGRWLSNLASPPTLPWRRSIATCAADGVASTFTVTTPLYYANAEPHMGGAYSTIAADVVARYQRMQGKPVKLITGTDEHGEKIAEAAAAAGVTPKDHCDHIAARYRELWSQLGISYDVFVRTTDAKHEATVLALLEAVWARGDVYRSPYRGLYCVACEEYKDPMDLGADGTCLIHRTPCLEREEDNYFFQLSKYSDVVQDFIARKGTVLPKRAAREVEAWVAEGARDFSISRSAVDWGIRMRRDPEHTVYVWFDALIGYLSALLPEAPRDAAGALTALRASGCWPAAVHILGKDILRFHAIYWPGMLHAMGLPPPMQVYGHGFLTRDGHKMGKSLGNVLDPFELIAAYGADAVRYYFMSEIVFGADGDFSEARFRENVNAALANTLGNLVQRCVQLLRKNCGGRAPVHAADVDGAHPLRAAVAAAASLAEAAYEELRFHEATAAGMAVCIRDAPGHECKEQQCRANALLDETAPWTALKNGTEVERATAAETVLCALEAARASAAMLAPVVPALASRVYTQLGLAEQYEDLRWEDSAQWGVLSKGLEFPKPTPVFKRLEGDLLLEDSAAAAPLATAA